MPSYCEYCKTLPPDNVHRQYHDFEYGFPLQNDDELFGRLVLEINQAGLSWDTILKKRKAFEKAYTHFSIQKVAQYQDADIARLLNDAGIIRNRLKINAAIYNAQQILAIQEEMGSFKNWLDHHQPQSKENWVKIFKKTFRFVGGEIVGEFLMSTGYLPSPHDEGCYVLEEIRKANNKVR